LDAPPDSICCRSSIWYCAPAIPALPASMTMAINAAR
jgi:hypothetical protein